MDDPQRRERRFDRLYERHFDALRAYAWRRDPGRADEIVAETFLVAWRRLDDVPREPLPWLIGVARMVRQNLSRGDRRQTALAERLAWEPAADDDFAGTFAERDAVRLALARLGERDREILLLATWEDLDARSIARVLGCTRANVAVRLLRARRRLALELMQDGRSVVLPDPTTSGGVSDAC